METNSRAPTRFNKHSISKERTQQEIEASKDQSLDQSSNPNGLDRKEPGYTFPDVSAKMVKRNKLEPIRREKDVASSKDQVATAPVVEDKNLFLDSPSALLKHNSQWEAENELNTLNLLPILVEEKKEPDDDFIFSQSLAEGNMLIEDIDQDPVPAKRDYSPSKTQKLRKLKSRKLRRRLKAGKSKSNKSPINVLTRKQP